MSGPSRPSARSLLGLAALLAVVWGASEGLDRWRNARAASAIREHSQHVELTLYTTSSCPYCAKARAWLDRHGARWRECNVETDARCQQDYAAQGSPGVPLVRAGQRWHLGFHAPWLAEALAGQAQSQPTSQAVKPSGASSPRP